MSGIKEVPEDGMPPVIASIILFTKNVRWCSQEARIGNPKKVN